MDNKVVQLTLNELGNILEVGEMDGAAAGPGAANRYVTYAEEAGGTITIRDLESQDDEDIYKKAHNVIDKYFPYSKEVDAGNGLSNVDTSGGFTMSPQECLLLVASKSLMAFIRLA